MELLRRVMVRLNGSAYRPGRLDIEGGVRLDPLVRRGLLDRLRERRHGAQLHVVRREGAAVAADVLPPGAEHPQLGVVDVAADLAAGVPGTRGERLVRRREVGAEGLP